MKKIFALLFLVSFALTGFSQENTKKILGKWTYTVDADGTIMTGDLHFFEKDGQMTGEILSNEGYIIPFTKLEQKEANQYYMEAKTESDLIKITLNFEGDKYTGMGASYQGEAPITGERKE